MTMDTVHHPLDPISDAESVLSFVSFIIDQAGHHGFASDLTRDDCRGLSKILGWVSDGIRESKKYVQESLEKRDLDVLLRVGLPEEAFDNDTMRRVWRDGFSHGQAHARKEP